jgi:hypothetical protein
VTPLECPRIMSTDLDDIRGGGSRIHQPPDCRRRVLCV